MRPVFEQQPVAFVQPLQVLVAVALSAGKQDLVMGVLHRLNAVQLHEPELLDERTERIGR